jgi:hypothetical protein
MSTSSKNYMKDERRRSEYNRFTSSNLMWKKTKLISNFLVENTKNTQINPVFIENVKSFIGELEKLKMYNNKNISEPFHNKCCQVIIPHLKKIVSLHSKYGMTPESMSLIRFEVSQIQTMSYKMTRRFNRLY